MKKISAIGVIVLFLNNASAQLQIGPNTSWRSDPATYVVLDNTGIQYDAATAPLTNIFKFTGNADVNIAGNNLLIFTKIELAKTGAAKVSLQRSINLTQSLNFLGGLFDLGNSVLNMGTNALLLNENETSRMMGADGYARIIANLNAPAAVNPGNIGLAITSSQDLGSTIIYRGVKSQTNTSGGGNSILRFFEIVPTNNTGLDATLRFNYFDAELNGLPENNLVFYKSPDNVNWTPQGFTSRDVATDYVELTGINDFTRFTLSTPGNPLPVFFVLFNIRCDGNKNSLQWKTAQEMNVSHYEVQQSADGINWLPIAIVAANNANGEHSYTYTDNNAASTGSLYRIAAVDVDGKRNLTGINRSACSASKDSWKVWPNPVQQSLWVMIQAEQTTTASVKIFDGKGSLVSNTVRNIINGNNLLELDMKKLSAGTYYLQLQWGEGKQINSMKIVKQ